MSERRAMFAGRRLSLAAVALLAVPLAAASTPAPPLDEIVARHVTARGGSKRLHALQTLRQTGYVTAGADRRALVTRELKRPGRIRFEFTVQGVTAVSICDGERGWQVSPLEGEMSPKPLPDDVVMEAMEQADIEGPLVDWKSKGHQLELVGREAVGGHDAYRLKLTLKRGAVQEVYVDARTFLVVRTDSTRLVKGRPVRIQTTFGDYRKTKGILFPRLIEATAAERPGGLRVVVEKIEVNPPLSDARFALSGIDQP